MHNLKESLQANDLRMLVKNIIEIDGYKSKMGEDADIVVLAFTVDGTDPSKDLVTFIENGYDFVLDADKSSGELSNGFYKVFVEIERNRKIAEQIMEVLDGVGKLADLDAWKFRYYKSFYSQPVSLDALRETIPTRSEDYEALVNQRPLSNFGNFFERSYLDEIDVIDDTITFQRKYAEPLRMRIKNFGDSETVYNQANGKIMLESQHMAEILFLTKYIGNFNITKIGETFIFDNNGYSVELEKL